MQSYVKNIGDSLLYYFPVDTQPADSIVSSIHCNLDIIQQRNDLNKALKEEGLPEISYRISGDFGKVFVAQSSLSLINDIFGPTVNMCAKINHVGKKNMFFVGSDLRLNIKNMNEFEFEEIVENQIHILKEIYPIFYVTEHSSK